MFKAMYYLLFNRITDALNAIECGRTRARENAPGPRAAGRGGAAYGRGGGIGRFPLYSVMERL